ncbi:MAG: glycine--tRNA ligase [Pseudomonadota bacterium]
MPVPIVKDMKEIVSLCKRRGFIFPASEIYGGINGFWDYGPLGTELKNNIRDYWWKSMVLTPPIGPDGQPLEIVGIDSAIIQNPKCWEASGHTTTFADPMTDCRETKKRYRADHVVLYRAKDGSMPFLAVEKGDDQPEMAAKRIKKFGRGKTIADYETCVLTDLPFAEFGSVLAPEASAPGTLTEPKAFNLLFETRVGALASSDNIAYLRGETCAGIFLNFKAVVDSSRVRIPFGIAQIGKAFRNEVTPRNFIFRSREFEQMELEWFCHPDDHKKWMEFWIDQRTKWWASIGITGEDLHFNDIAKAELAHYSSRTVDVEYRFPFSNGGFDELEGIAHRGAFDLTQHQEFSKTKLEYIDPVSNERYLPHVIEPSAGLSRGVLAVLCQAFTPDPSRPSGLYLNFHPRIAPKKAAILPLVAKDGQPELATQLYRDLREDFTVELDIKQNIGKRYARQDEIGTPFCFTIDNQSVEDKTVTVRHRNTMHQERIGMDHVASFLHTHMKAANTAA